MSEGITQADHITMSSGGLYSLATIGAKDVIDRAIPRVLAAIDEIDTQANDLLSFSDMGCADGGTSLDLWRSVIGKIRGSSDRDIQIIYADQVFNDFNALVKILHGHTSFKTFLNEYENLHILQSGSSFYSPIVPQHSLHLGFSATAMHWLRQKPCNISDHIHMVGASSSEAEQFARQGAEDWQTILLHRSRELKPGGRLVLINFCIDEQGRYLGNTDGVNMFDNFNSNWMALLEDGTIQQAEYLSMTLPQYYNTVEEFIKPLKDPSSAVYQAGLRLVDIETAIVACPFAEDFRQHGDAGRFAKAYIPTIRSWNESVFLGALSDNRPIEQRHEIIEHYYGMYESQVRNNPQGHGMAYVHAYMTIERI